MDAVQSFFLTRSFRVLRRAPVAIAIAVVVVVVMMMTAQSAYAHYEPCTVVSGKDSCPQAERCSRTDGLTGLCLPPPCDADVDCKFDPLRKCDKRQDPSVCIGCYADNECAVAPMFTCELDPRSPLSNRCVECAVGRNALCADASTGHLCVLSTGLCGCSTNADCPAQSFCRRNACIPRPASSFDGGLDEGSDASARGDATTTSSEPSTLDASGGGCSVSELGAMEGSLGLGAFALVALTRGRRRRTRKR